MICPTEADWSEWGVDEPAHRFFYLRWVDLFDEETADAWQLKYSNLQTIMLEIKSSLDVVKKIHKHHPNILELLNEAATICKKDRIIKEYFPFARTYIEMLIQRYNELIKNKDKCDTVTFNTLVDVLSGNIARYYELLVRKIEEVLNKDQNFKDELYDYSMSLAIYLSQYGYSIYEMRDSAAYLIDPGTDSFVERFKKMVTSFDQRLKDFECRFMVQWPLKNREFENVIIYKDGSDEASEGEYEFYAQDSDAFIASIDVKAIDPYSARYEAEKCVERIFSITRLYYPSKTSSIKHDKALILCGDNRFIVNKDESRLGYIKDSKVGLKSLNNIIETIKELGIYNADQIYSSLQYHKLAMSADTDDARLINLWIAIESIIYEGESSVVERVSSLISASCATLFFYKTVLALAMSIKEIWKASDNAELLQHLSSRSLEHRLDYKDLFDILTENDGSEKLEFLANILSVNDLAIYRCKRVSRLISGNAKDIADRVESHYNSIKWQIIRIYRARNDIMHKGERNIRMRQLIQHLHSYYINTIHNIIDDVYRFRFKSISSALEHRRFLYNKFIAYLKQCGDQPIDRHEILLSPILLLKSE